MLGPGTAVVAGQRFPMETRAAWAPIAYGSSAQVAPLPQLSIPPIVGANWSAPATTSPVTGGMAAVGPSNAALAAPFNLKVSPVIWAVLFLVVGLIGLRIVHWR